MKYLKLSKLLLASALLSVTCLHAEEAYETDWLNQFGTSSTDYAESVVTDSDGNVYVSGWTYAALNGETNLGLTDAYISKYNTDGDLLWSKQFGTPSYEECYSMIIDKNNNIFVVGATNGTFDGEIYIGGYNDFFISKYSSSGTMIWTRQFGTTGDDLATTISADVNGNVLVTGTTDGTFDGEINSGGKDAFIVKYSNDGVRLWSKQFGTLNNDEAEAITTDSNSNVFVTGTTDGTFDGEVSSEYNDVFIAKYSADGVYLWAKQYGSSSWDLGDAIITDNSDNIFIAGFTYGALEGQVNLGNADAFISKLNNDGTLLWNKQFGTASYDTGNSIAIDNSGNLFVAGRTAGVLEGETTTTTSSASDILVTKHNSDGVLIWNKQFGTSTYDFGKSIAVDGSGNLFVAGWTYGTFDGWASNGGYEAFITKLSSPNTPPIAFATATPQVVIVNGTTVELDASQSYDEDGDNISYEWSWVEKPENSEATFSSTTSLNPTFIADIKGNYNINLKVTDSFATSTNTEVLVSFDNIQPVADAGAYAPVNAGEYIYLTGIDSHDANQDTLTYKWTILSKPEGSVSTITNSEDVQAILNTDIDGTYIVSLTVNDGVIDSDPSSATIEVLKGYSSTELLEEAIREILGMSNSCFKNRHQRKVLVKKLSATMKRIANLDYEKALYKLQNDLLPKVDGYATKNAIDRTDWIVTPEEQLIIYGLLVESIDKLEGLI